MSSPITTRGLPEPQAEHAIINGDLMYVCHNCEKEIEELGNFVRCPYCAWRILYKPPLPVARVIKAD